MTKGGFLSRLYPILTYTFCKRKRQNRRRTKSKSFANLYLKRLEISREAKRLPKVRKDEAMALDPFLLYIFFICICRNSVKNR